MNLLEFNNKRVKVRDVIGQEWIGIALFEDKDTYDDEQDGLSIKTGFKWVKIFEDEIKSIEII